MITAVNGVITLANTGTYLITYGVTLQNTEPTVQTLAPSYTLSLNGTLNPILGSMLSFPLATEAFDAGNSDSATNPMTSISVMIAGTAGDILRVDYLFTGSGIQFPVASPVSAYITIIQID